MAASKLNRKYTRVFSFVFRCVSKTKILHDTSTLNFTFLHLKRSQRSDPVSKLADSKVSKNNFSPKRGVLNDCTGIRFGCQRVPTNGS